MRDMAKKGRARIPGLAREQHPGAKLTEAQVAAIRLRLAAGTETHRAIAQAFGVSRPTITAIHTRRLWP
jgi:DNA invertase Pin-like site-specific DNA recombinase